MGACLGIMDILGVLPSRPGDSTPQGPIPWDLHSTPWALDYLTSMSSDTSLSTLRSLAPRKVPEEGSPLLCGGFIPLLHSHNRGLPSGHLQLVQSPAWIGWVSSHLQTQSTMQQGASGQKKPPSYLFRKQAENIFSWNILHIRPQPFYIFFVLISAKSQTHTIKMHRTFSTIPWHIFIPPLLNWKRNSLH